MSFIVLHGVFASASLGRKQTQTFEMHPNAGTTRFGRNTKAVRELGYNPRPLAVGLAETLHHEMQLLRKQPAPAVVAH